MLNYERKEGRGRKANLRQKQNNIEVFMAKPNYTLLEISLYPI